MTDKCKWYPMETAPRDGRSIFAKWNGNIVGVVHWNSERKNPSDPFWIGVAGKMQFIPANAPNEWTPLA